MEFIKSLTILSIIDFALLGLVFLAGIVFALIRWKRHRGVSIITMIALLFWFGSTLVLTVSRFYFIETQTRNILDKGGDDRFYTMALTYHGTFGTLLDVGYFIQPFLIVVFLVAIFAGRAKTNAAQN